MSDQIAVIQEKINLSTKEFQKVLPPSINADRFARVLITGIKLSPQYDKLVMCSPQSIIATGMKAAEDGLLLDGREAAIIPYKKGKGDDAYYQAQYMPMIKGVMKKVKQTKEVLTISTHVAYENDVFEYVLGDEEKIIHKPELDASKRGSPTYVYAIVTMKDGGVYREIMSYQEIEKARGCSATEKAAAYYKKTDTVWFVWWEEMAKKTVLHRLCKYKLPLSSDIDLFMQETLKNDGYDDAIESTAIEIKPYPDRFFNTNLPKWEESLGTGEQTVDGIKEFLYGRGYELAQAQIEKLEWLVENATAN